MQYVFCEFLKLIMYSYVCFGIALQWLLMFYESFDHMCNHVVPSDRFHQMMACPGTYYIVVVEDTTVGKVIGSATLTVEMKFIRQCNSVCLIFI